MHSSPQDGGRIHIVFNPKASQREPDWHTMPEHGLLQQIEQELDTLVGMTELKAFLRELYALLYIQSKRREVGISSDAHMLHMLFTGNPGTGKTTAARLVARMLRQMGVLEKGHFIEAERADLVGEYIGHTAQKTRDLVKKALGGVLFIDEAYSLARGGEKDFGKEAVDTLVKQMEDHQSRFVLILAGYPREMTLFLSMNPGLQSRFPLMHHFTDYTADELVQIARKMAVQKQYELPVDAQAAIRAAVEYERLRLGSRFANGRTIRTLIERAVRRHALRLMADPAPSRLALKRLMPEDFQLSGESEMW